MRLGGVEGRVLRVGMELDAGVGMLRVLGIRLAEEEVGLGHFLFRFLDNFIKIYLQYPTSCEYTVVQLQFVCVGVKQVG